MTGNADLVSIGGVVWHLTTRRGLLGGIGTSIPVRLSPGLIGTIRKRCPDGVATFDPVRGWVDTYDVPLVISGNDLTFLEDRRRLMALLDD